MVSSRRSTQPGTVWQAVRLAGRIALAGCLLAGWIWAIGLYLYILDYLLTRR
jgi:hypothetical protein